MLESIDLRQSDAPDYGPTGLDNEFVSDILSTVLFLSLKNAPVASLCLWSIWGILTATTWENHNLRVNAPDQLLGGTGGQAYAWSFWSDGGEQSHTIPIPPGSGVTESYVAEFTEFFGTFPPGGTSLHPSECPPSFLGIATYVAELRSGQTYRTLFNVVYALQRDDGNLMVFKGSPTNPGDFRPKRWMSTRTVLTILGIDCTCTVVVVMQGTPENPTKNLIWQSGPFPEPGEIPIVGTVNENTAYGSMTIALFLLPHTQSTRHTNLSI